MADQAAFPVMHRLHQLVGQALGHGVVDHAEMAQDRAHGGAGRTAVAVIGLQADAVALARNGTGEHALGAALQQAGLAGLRQDRAVEPAGAGDQQRMLGAGGDDPAGGGGAAWQGVRMGAPAGTAAAPSTPIARQEATSSRWMFSASSSMAA